jgi:Fe-S-cluster-containing dehydrogenase component
MSNPKYGLLIDFQWCTGCHACEIAGKNANDLAYNEWCIKVGTGERKVGERVVYDFIPIPTHLCNLCARLTSKGEQPACVHHCPPQVISFGPEPELQEARRLKPSQNLWILDGK